jgi:hypothetical protein
MEKNPRGHIQVRVPSLSNRALIDFLKAISTRLHAHQTVGEEFSHSQLAELGAEFNLADSDWGQLCYMIHRPKH